MSVTNRVSPGLTVIERDLTKTINADNALNGAFAGMFSWGPKEPTLVSSEDDVIKLFGKPNDTNYKDWFNAVSFTKEVGSLYVARVTAADAYNATSISDGVGATVDITVSNGSVDTVAVNNAGSGYIVGDIIIPVGGIDQAELRVITTDDNGGVLTLLVVDSGTGISAGTAVATTLQTKINVDSEEEFNNSLDKLPTVIAKYPGSVGNNYTVAIMRADEYQQSGYKRFFNKAPDSKSEEFIGNGVERFYNINADTLAATDRSVYVGTRSYKQGVNPGDYRIVGNQIEIIHQTQSESGTGIDAEFVVPNTYNVPQHNARVTVGGAGLRRTDASGHVAGGLFRLADGKLTIGTENAVLSPDGVTTVFNITTPYIVTDATCKVTLTEPNNVVTHYTVVSAAPNAGEVEIQSIPGGYSFTFNTAPAAGSMNLEIEWGFPALLDAIELEYGAPAQYEVIKVVYDQKRVHAVVYDNDLGSAVETYNNLSIDPNSPLEFNVLSYVVDHINKYSSTIRLSRLPTQFGEWRLSNGSDGSVPSTGEYVLALDAFANRENFDIVYIIDPVVDSTVTAHVSNIASTRKDCVAFVGVPFGLTYSGDDKVKAVVDYVKTLPSSSYAHMNPIWGQLYDAYNDTYRWVPITGTDAGLYAKRHANLNMWSVGAGFNYGEYTRMRNVSWLPSEAERDELYPNAINPVVQLDGQSFYLFGQKTMLNSDNSAFSRMNVRFLSIYLRRGLVKYLRFVYFEINDEITRAQVRNAVAPFMRQVQSGRGVYDFLVKCDSDNNTPQVIDDNELVCSIYLKPTRLIEKIGLILSYTQTGISFSEVEF